MDKIFRQRLLDAGFAPPAWPTKDTSLIKIMKANQMPYVRKHMLDDEQGISEFDDVLIHINSDETTVRMSIPNADYHEDPLPIEGDGQGVLRDAGVKL